MKDKVQMVAPIEEVVAAEMEIDDDGEGEEDARMEPRADEPGDVPPPPRPREVRPSAMRPGAETVRLHKLIHCPYQSWCEVCVASKGSSAHYHREAPQPIDCDIARIQMDFIFVGAEGTFVVEPRAKATVLMVICKDDGNLYATEVCWKTDEYGVEMVIRFLSTYDSVEIKTDGESSIVEVATRQNNDFGTNECWRSSRNWSCGTFEWKSAGAVASVFSGCAKSNASQNHSRYTDVSMDVASFCLDGGALPV